MRRVAGQRAGRAAQRPPHRLSRPARDQAFHFRLVGPVVDGVSFTLQPGRALGLVGESGCGKTVTALSVASLLPVPGRSWPARSVSTALSSTVLGERALSRYRGRRIGFVTQEPMSALHPSFTIGSQLSEVVRPHARVSRSSARKRAAELLSEVGILEPHTVARAFPHELSGGMAQRVSIALALAGEPTTALDVTVQAAILDLLRGLIAARGNRAAASDPRPGSGGRHLRRGGGYVRGPDRRAGCHHRSAAQPPPPLHGGLARGDADRRRRDTPPRSDPRQGSRCPRLAAQLTDVRKLGTRLTSRFSWPGARR